jgi:hypothetical protein
MSPTRITSTTRITTILAATTAAAALTVPPASAMRPPVNTAPRPAACSVWHRLVGLNPSLLKPRGHEDRPESRRWVIECFG